jgi:hypothetical protein
MSNKSSNPKKEWNDSKSQVDTLRRGKKHSYKELEFENEEAKITFAKMLIRQAKEGGQIIGTNFKVRKEIAGE